MKNRLFTLDNTIRSPLPTIRYYSLLIWIRCKKCIITSWNKAWL